MLAFPPDVTFVIQLVSFFVFLLVLNRLLFAPFAELIAERERRTDGAKRDAAHAQAEAETLARTIERGLQEARTRASAEAEAIRRKTHEHEVEIFNRAKNDAAERLAALRKAIARERESAKKILRDEARGLAAGMVEAVLRPSANG
jgi:F-type H+-transporting ATPase subunit b